jgi:hypothetical protein
MLRLPKALRHRAPPPDWRTHLVDDDQLSLAINPEVPNAARVYDYLLGGKDNFPADREVAERVMQVAPMSRDITRQNRAFLRRVVRFLTGDAGVRQFLDIGSGLPTQGNVHEIAQAIAPDTRVVYVDNDPVVVTHGRALLAGKRTAVVRADLREPEAILQDPQVKEFLDFDRPIALLLFSMLHFLGDDQEPDGIVARYRDALPAGSYLALSHGTADPPPRHDLTPERAAEMAAEATRLYRQATIPVTNRGHAQVLRFFGDWELVDPGLIWIQQWKPDAAKAPPPGGFYGGIARKPG